MRKNLPWFLIGIPLLAMTITNLLIWPNLPDRIPIHWNFQGEVDSWGGRGSVWILPGIYFWVAGFLQLTTLHLSRSDEPSHRISMNWFLTGLASLFLYLHANTLLTALDPASKPTVPLVAWGFACFTIFSGLAFKKSKRNNLIGIRTKWTLASDEIWDKTHRYAGGLFTTAGVWMAFAAYFFDFNLMVWVGVLVAVCCLAAFYSYRLYKTSKSSL